MEKCKFLNRIGLGLGKKGLIEFFVTLICAPIIVIIMMVLYTFYLKNVLIKKYRETQDGIDIRLGVGSVNQSDYPTEGKSTKLTTTQSKSFISQSQNL